MNSEERSEGAAEVVHDCPRHGETVTLCCRRSPFELPRSDRMTLDSALVTCPIGRVAEVPS